jgi:hypothetical protein
MVTVAVGTSRPHTWTVKPLFFPSPAAWRAWLAASHETSRELWVGFYKKGSGKPSITWPEAVADEKGVEVQEG